MGDNKKKWLWISLGIVAGILVLGYIGTALYFMSHFLPNTKVNGKDFSYAKEEDVADYLKSEVKKYELKITEHAGLSDIITGKEISVEYKENGDGHTISHVDMTKEDGVYSSGLFAQIGNSSGKSGKVILLLAANGDIVFIPQCHRQLFDMNLCAADVVECPFLEIQMQQIENVLLSVVQLCIHIDIVADLLIRIFHTVQMVHPHLGSVTVI